MSPAELETYTRKYATKNLTLRELEQFDVGRLNRDEPVLQLFSGPARHRRHAHADSARSHPLRESCDEKQSRLSDRNENRSRLIRSTARTRNFSRKALYKILKEEKIIDRAEIQAFDFRCLYELQTLDPHVKSAYLTSRENEKGGPDDFFSADPKVAGRWTGGKLVKDYGGSIPKMVKALGGLRGSPKTRSSPQESLEEAHRLGSESRRLDAGPKISGPHSILS